MVNHQTESGLTLATIILKGSQESNREIATSKPQPHQKPLSCKTRTADQILNGLKKKTHQTTPQKTRTTTTEATQPHQILRELQKVEEEYNRLEQDNSVDPVCKEQLKELRDFIKYLKQVDNEAQIQEHENNQFYKMSLEHIESKTETERKKLIHKMQERANSLIEAFVNYKAHGLIMSSVNNEHGVNGLIIDPIVAIKDEIESLSPQQKNLIKDNYL